MTLDELGNRQQFDPKRFALAVTCGVALQIVLLAFGMHASLFLSRFVSSPAAYWALNGVYFGAGLSVLLALVPWHRLGVRLAVAGALIASLALWGWSRA